MVQLDGGSFSWACLMCATSVDTVGKGVPSYNTHTHTHTHTLSHTHTKRCISMFKSVSRGAKFSWACFTCATGVNQVGECVGPQLTVTLSRHLATQEGLAAHLPSPRSFDEKRLTRDKNRLILAIPSPEFTLDTVAAWTVFANTLFFVNCVQTQLNALTLKGCTRTPH